MATAAVLATALRERLAAEANGLSQRFADLRERLTALDALERVVADRRRRLMAQLLVLDRVGAAAAAQGAPPAAPATVLPAGPVRRTRR